MRGLLVAVLALPLTGCAVAAVHEARDDYRQAVDEYKSCLAANSSAPQHCEGLRLAMEADERKYNNLSAALKPEGQRSANVTILSR